MALTFLLDTNVVLYYLGGKLAEGLPNGILCVSVITEIELLSYPGLTGDEEARIKEFLSRVNIVELSADVKSSAIGVRKASRLKLPDAIVAATALVLGATLLSNDSGILKAEGMVSTSPKLVQ